MESCRDDFFKAQLRTKTKHVFFYTWQTKDNDLDCFGIHWVLIIHDCRCAPLSFFFFII